MGLKFKEHKHKQIKFKEPTLGKEFTPKQIIKTSVALGTTVVAVAAAKKLLE